MLNFTVAPEQDSVRTAFHHGQRGTAFHHGQRGTTFRLITTFDMTSKRP